MAPVAAAAPGPSWRDRFYTIEGQRLPSVTTILDIIAKPALGPWYAKEERRYFETAMLEVLSRPGARDPELVLAAVAQAVTGVKAADREKQKAAAIGTAVHAGIEWELRRQLAHALVGPAVELEVEAAEPAQHDRARVHHLAVLLQRFRPRKRGISAVPVHSDRPALAVGGEFVRDLRAAGERVGMQLRIVILGLGLHRRRRSEVQRPEHRVHHVARPIAQRSGAERHP